jgi:uracil-DNA glycosylase family protein
MSRLVEEEAQTGSAARYLPDNPATLSFDEVRARAARCEACPLYKLGTQTVFGEGPSKARLVLVGEQPGDREDRSGRPFVGPAGRLLDQALAEAGLSRSDLYLTNAVKHFKSETVGLRRLHKKPGAREIAACRPWLEAELAIIAPEVVVALGATAAQTLMGRAFRVTQARGHPFHDTRWAQVLFATVHPASLLRAPSEQRAEGFRDFVLDLRRAAKALRDTLPARQRK